MNQIVDPRLAQQTFHLIVAGRRRDHQRHSIGEEALEQRAGARGWPELREISLLEDSVLPLANRLAVTRVALEADERRDELVTPHPDERPHVIERDIHPVFGERTGERRGMRIVAVEERPVDVEENAFEASGYHAGTNSKKAAVELLDRPQQVRNGNRERSCGAGGRPLERVTLDARE